MDCTVVKLTRYPAKGADGEPLVQARFIEGQGMEGDFHACGGQKQISLLTVEERTKMDAYAEPGLCFGRYRENILLDGISPDALVPGKKIKTGGAVLEISDTGKRCFEECYLHRSGQSCFLAGRSLFARVICGGLVRTGDHVYDK